MNTTLLHDAFLIWLAEIAVSGFNYFILMKKVYEPRVGELRAHQIGMSTRIVYVFLFATVLFSVDGSYSTLDLVYVGLFSLILTPADRGRGFAHLRPVLVDDMTGATTGPVRRHCSSFRSVSAIDSGQFGRPHPLGA